MTDHDADVMATIYRLGDLIREKNWPEAEACWTWLLNTYAPLATMQPYIATVLKEHVVLLELAGRQTRKVH